MKQKLLIALLAACAVSAQAALKIGDKMPARDVKLKGEGGKETTLAELSKGKRGTLVVITCNNCPWAKDWERRIVDIGNDWSQKPEFGMSVVAINPNDPTMSPSDSLDKIVARAKKEFYKFPYLQDTTQKLSKEFGATKTPECYLFDAKGVLVYHGAVDDSRDSKKVQTRYLQSAFNSMRHGEPLKFAETKAVGCGIKYR